LPQTPTTFHTPATSEVVSGLTNGATYTFKVAAFNANGSGPPSAPGGAIVVGAPGVPTAVTATAGIGKATVHWTAPATDNGAAITGYVVTGKDPRTSSEFTIQWVYLSDPLVEAVDLGGFGQCGGADGGKAKGKGGGKKGGFHHLSPVVVGAGSLAPSDFTTSGKIRNRHGCGKNFSGRSRFLNPRAFGAW